MMTRLLSVVVLLASSVYAQQQQTGKLRLDVKDPAGKTVEALGKLVSLSTGVSRNFQTNAQGVYILDSLPFGRYRLEIIKEGFATQSALIEVQSTTLLARTVTLTL